MVIHKCSICGKKHINCIRVLQSYICVNCEKNICNLVAFNNINYNSYMSDIRRIWTDYI